MAGSKLDPEKKAKREAEREALFGKRKSKTEEKPPITESSMSEETKDTQNQGTDANTSNVNQEQTNDQAQNQNQGTDNGADGLSNGAKFQPNTQWKPFKGDRIKRDYATPEINQELINTDIPEPSINIEQVSVQNAEDILNKTPSTGLPGSDQAPSNNSQKPAVQQPTPVNSEWSNMSPQEQLIAAEAAADMMIGVYDKLHYFGREYIKVDEEELIELHNDDKIDMNAAVMENDEDPDKEISIKEFWQDFNKQVDDRFIVTDTFKQKIRPPLVRLCNKHGLGASDMMQVAFYAGEDAATKIAMLVGFKKTVNKMNDHFMKNHAKFKKAVEDEVARRMEASGQTSKGTSQEGTANYNKDNDQNPGDIKNDQKEPPPTKDEGGDKK